MAKDNPSDTTVHINGEDYTLRLTLGGMAMLEDAFGLATLTELQARLAEPSMRDIEKIARIMIQCGTGERVAEDFFVTADIDLSELLPAIMNAMKKAMTLKGKASSGNAPRAKA